MFTVYLIKVFGVGMLAFALALIKCCGVAINVAVLPNVRETLLRKLYSINISQETRPTSRLVLISTSPLPLSVRLSQG